MRHPYADLAHKVERPARYLGGELHSVVKTDADVRIVLAFPDTYEIGMSHLGTKILYSLLNSHTAIACERAFTPWPDLEAQLRQNGLPLVSLETARPLRDFDVIGISLQYELVYTNVLTLLDLGGVPLRARDRGEHDPLVLGGGPTATHPEPVAPFFDAFFIGEAEEELPKVLLEWNAMRRAGRTRLSALEELATRYPLYVPALYSVVEDPSSRLLVVSGGARIRRGIVADLDKFPFPTNAPVPYAEAVFDRAAIEIARGCTEGCRFCQGGMIYRPVRERRPDAIRDAVLETIASCGYDEASLTSLSTADYSCLTPLVARLMAELRARKVSLSVSSLRAYGLSADLLDELASVRATSLTFAPEAGTQRLRDVINKNVTEEHIHASAERVWKKGWQRLKLYFMIGLPTETDDDVKAIMETGARVLALGRKQIGRNAEVTVSVSSHVPKPHTPFQWCQMDGIDELGRKQRLLVGMAAEKRPQVRLKYHEKGLSFVEGILARGDRRLADVIEAAWRDGARFDSWDELFDMERWQRALASVEPELFLGPFPMDARLPWDHIDVGLADGFLASEHRKAMKARRSPPCGKPLDVLVHHQRAEDARADDRKLICYDCGLACDMEKMRADRLARLQSIEEHAPVARGAPRADESPTSRRRPVPRASFSQGEGTSYRLAYTKLSSAAFLSHLDVLRLLGRIFRRADVPVIYSRGFHPKPTFTFGPALGLGIPSLGELLDAKLDEDLGAEALLERLTRSRVDGLRFTHARRTLPGTPGLGRLIQACDFLLQPRRPLARELLDSRVEAILAKTELPIVRAERTLNVRHHLVDLSLLSDAETSKAQLDWPSAPFLIRARVRVSPEGSIKPRELTALLDLDGALVARVALGSLGSDGHLTTVFP